MQAVGCHFASGQKRSRPGPRTDEPPNSDGDISFVCLTRRGPGEQESVHRLSPLLYPSVPS